MGYVLAGVGAGMVVCALLGWLLAWLDQLRPDDVRAMFVLGGSGVLTLLAGGWVWSTGRHEPLRGLGRREASLAVGLIWMAAGVFGGLPYVLMGFRPEDAFFETISGFTTTGTTIMTHIEAQPRPLLLWRAFTQWLGGMGIVLLFVAILPTLGVGAKHLFRSEVPVLKAEGIQPRIGDTARILWLIYVGLTAVLVGILWLLGMTVFDAVSHAFTTMPTGGFSTRDASVAAFDSAAIEAVITVFMVLGAVNFALYFGIWRRKSLRLLARSTEFKVYIVGMLVISLLISALILPVHDWNPLQALRYGTFQTATFLTSTGYTTDDYMGYAPAAVVLIVCMMFTGGSSGSTSAGFKIVRVALLAKTAWNQTVRSFRPSVVTVVRLGRNPVSPAVLNDVAALFFLWVSTIALVALLVALLEGVSVPTAFGASLTSVSNMGPAPFHLEGADNAAHWSASTKVLLSLAMVLGRLEFFTLLALVVPSFWKR